MIERENHKDCLFSGKFEVTELYGQDESGWVLLQHFEPGSTIWFFVPDAAYEFPSGVVAYEGKLKEYAEGQPEEVTDSSWYPGERLLLIDRSDYAPDGFCDICINDRYRVEETKGSACWLYDLEDVEPEPADYRYRLKLEKT